MENSIAYFDRRSFGAKIFIGKTLEQIKNVQKQYCDILSISEIIDQRLLQKNLGDDQLFKVWNQLNTDSSDLFLNFPNGKCGISLDENLILKLSSKNLQKNSVGSIILDPKEEDELGLSYEQLIKKDSFIEINRNSKLSFNLNNYKKLALESKVLQTFLRHKDYVPSNLAHPNNNLLENYFDQINFQDNSKNSNFRIFLPDSNPKFTTIRLIGLSQLDLNEDSFNGIYNSGFYSEHGLLIGKPKNPGLEIFIEEIRRKNSYSYDMVSKIREKLDKFS